MAIAVMTSATAHEDWLTHGSTDATETSGEPRLEQLRYIGAGVAREHLILLNASEEQKRGVVNYLHEQGLTHAEDQVHDVSGFQNIADRIRDISRAEKDDIPTLGILNFDPKSVGGVIGIFKIADKIFGPYATKIGEVLLATVGRVGTVFGTNDLSKVKNLKEIKSGAAIVILNHHLNDTLGISPEHAAKDLTPCIATQ